MELDTQLMSPAAGVGRRTQLWKRFKKQKVLHVFVGLGMIFLLIFSYTPMFGILMAFKDYSISNGIKGIFTSEWVGLRYFDEFIHDYQFATIVRNTLVLSFLKVIFAFPAPILLAIMLNEVKNMAFKRFVQTISYLPHFISWVVVVGVSYAFLSADVGMVNRALIEAGFIDKPLNILTSPNYFWGLAVGSAIWKEMGWWTIIFLAAITAYKPALGLIQTQPDSKEKTIKTKIDEMIKNEKVKIYRASSEEEAVAKYENMVKTAENMGLQELVDWANETYRKKKDLFE